MEADSGQKVNRAVAMAVRRLVDGAKDTANRDGLAKTIGKRIQGMYGFDLRRQADLHLEMTAEELYALVIVPHEFPWDSEASADMAGSASGARDKARAHRDGPFFDPDDPDLTPPEEVPSRMAEIRGLLRGGARP